jgi:acetylornithine aminotransferase
MPTYARLNATFERGEGVWLWDEHQQRYLDALSGIAVCNLGHAHPYVSDAICRQSTKLLHTSNAYTIAVQEQLAQKLIEMSGMTNVFFSNSGAEANEAAIKLARKFGHHANTLTSLVLLSQKKVFTDEHSQH